MTVLGAHFAQWAKEHHPVPFASHAMPTLSTVRSRAFAPIAFVLASACAGATPSPDPGPVPGRTSNGGQPPMSIPLVQTTWPVRTREHLDLWLHSYALINPDTTLVPYFRRGYRERIGAVRRQRGVTSLIETNRERLVARIAVEPSLATSGQFLPLYFASWEQMRQVIDLFVRNNGNPGQSNDPAVASYFALLGGAFQSAADREWLRLFTESVDDESRRFYHDYWVGESRSHTAVISHVDSLWQRQWRPALQRYLNNTQQQNGELYLSMPLGGEGRTVQVGKGSNAVAGPMPDAFNESESVLYVAAHEITGGIANAAIADNTTPADRRTGSSSRYEQAAAVRAGALLLERTIPTAVAGYMRYYLQGSGRSAPNDPRAAFAAAFMIPDSVRDAMTRQLDVVLGGI